MTFHSSMPADTEAMPWLVPENESRPAPMVPADANLQSFTWFPIEVSRLRNSTFAIEGSGEGFRAAVLLWCVAWHQLPASSLPTSDRELAHLAGFGRDQKSWMDVKAEALRGFVECSDGRLYHPLLSEKAVAAWDSLKANRARTEGARKKREENRRKGANDNHSDDDCDNLCDRECDDHSHRDQRKGDERRGDERKREQTTSRASAHDPAKPQAATDTKAGEPARPITLEPTTPPAPAVSGSQPEIVKRPPEDFRQGHIHVDGETVARWEAMFTSTNVRGELAGMAMWVQKHVAPEIRLGRMASMLAKKDKEAADGRFKIQTDAEARAKLGNTAPARRRPGI